MSRNASRSLVVAVAVIAAVLVVPPKAEAGPATNVTLADVATAMTAGKDIDGVFVTLKDTNNATDTGYTGTVTFSVTKGGNPCNDCVEVSLTSAPFTPLASLQYTYTGSDSGSKTFFVRWKSGAIGTSVLHVSATLQTGGPATTQSGNVTVTSNAATTLDLMNVATSINAGVADGINIAMRNANNQTGADYTGTVTFSASCGACFTITPNNGGANADKYTFVAGDAGSKALTLTWLNSAVSPPDRTFTATGDGGLATPAESATVTVGASATTTTSTSTTTTTSTTTPPSTTTTSTTSTSTTTTSTTSTTSTTATSTTSTTSTTLPTTASAPRIVTGAGAGGGPHVITRATSGAVRSSFYAYDAGFGGGVSVAAGDVTGDGVADVVTGAGRGGGPHVKVFDGVTGAEVRSFYAYAPTFRGGVFVAAGDINGDGKAEIVTGAGAGGGPHVIVFNGATGATLASYYAFHAGFDGGVHVAVGDVAGDSTADVIAAAGAGGGPHVKVFDGVGSTALRSFYAYHAAFDGGVFVAAGDVDGDGRRDVITGAGPGGGPHVRVMRGGASSDEVASFYAFASDFRGGVRVAAADLSGDAHAEVVAGAALGLPLLRVFDGATRALGLDIHAYAPEFRGGVFVAAATGFASSPASASPSSASTTTSSTAVPATSTASTTSTTTPAGAVPNEDGVYEEDGVKTEFYSMDDMIDWGDTEGDRTRVKNRNRVFCGEAPDDRPTPSFDDAIAEMRTTVGSERLESVRNATTTADDAVAYAGAALVENNVTVAGAAFLVAIERAPSENGILASFSGMLASAAQGRLAVAVANEAIARGKVYTGAMGIRGIALAYNNLGHALIVLGRYSEAVTALEQAETHDSALGEATTNKSVALTCLGRDDDAATAARTRREDKTFDPPATPYGLPNDASKPGIERPVLPLIYDLADGKAKDLPFNGPGSWEKLVSWHERWSVEAPAHGQRAASERDAYTSAVLTSDTEASKRRYNDFDKLAGTYQWEPSIKPLIVAELQRHDEMITLAKQIDDEYFPNNEDPSRRGKPHEWCSGAPCDGTYEGYVAYNSVCRPWFRDKYGQMAVAAQRAFAATNEAWKAEQLYDTGLLTHVLNEEFHAKLHHRLMSSQEFRIEQLMARWMSFLYIANREKPVITNDGAGKTTYAGCDLTGATLSSSSDTPDAVETLAEDPEVVLTCGPLSAISLRYKIKIGAVGFGVNVNCEQIKFDGSLGIAFAEGAYKFGKGHTTLFFGAKAGGEIAAIEGSIKTGAYMEIHNGKVYDYGLRAKATAAISDGPLVIKAVDEKWNFSIAAVFDHALAK